MSTARSMVLPLYTAGLLVLAITIVEILPALRGMQWGDAAWRYGMLGLLTRSIPSVAVVYVLTAGAAVLGRHRRVLLAMGVIMAVLGVSSLVTSGVFALDALQLRADLQPSANSGFEVASILGVTKMGLAFLAYLLLSVASFRMRKAAGRTPRRSEARSEESSENPVLLDVAT